MDPLGEDFWSLVEAEVWWVRGYLLSGVWLLPSCLTCSIPCSLETT